MVGLVLLYVGGVLFVNGIWILGHIEDREVAIMNLFTGAVGVFVAILAAVRNDFELAGYVLLFAFTYLWVAYNRFTKVDGRGLGWYCLFVAITAVPVGITVLSRSGGDTWLVWLGINWLAWGVLWFMYFLLLAARRAIAKMTGVVTILEAIGTAWLPAYLLLSRRLAG